MSMGMPLESTKSDEKGRRLCCQRCGSEIEIINPSRLERPDQNFRCCGEAMMPTTGRDVNLGVE